MKQFLFLIIALTIVNTAFSQTPMQFKYQAVLRDANGNIIASQAKTVIVDILQDSPTGTNVFTETHNVTTTAQGVINLNIGSVNTTGIAAINWATNTYYIKITVGGIVMGTSQLLSVPYALYAKTSGSSGGSHYLGEEYLGGIIYHLFIGSDGLQHGLVVSKTEGTGTWSGSTLVGADRTEDGAYNMTKMPTGAGTARAWVESLGAGWYLPSIDELSLLWYSRYYVNKMARAKSYTLLSISVYYWSSTEKDATYAFYLDFSNGSLYTYPDKTGTYSIRGVRSF
jgi:hypothetical protein